MDTDSVTGFHVQYRVKDGYQWQELGHSGDRLHGLQADMDDIEVGDRARAALFVENVFGWLPWEIEG